MDNYFKLELDSWGISFTGAQAYGGLSYLGLGLIIAAVVLYRLIRTGSLRFYLSQVGKRCGHLECNRRGWLPAYSTEENNRGLWVSCGRIH